MQTQTQTGLDRAAETKRIWFLAHRADEERNKYGRSDAAHVQVFLDRLRIGETVRADAVIEFVKRCNRNSGADLRWLPSIVRRLPGYVYVPRDKLVRRDY